MCVCVCARRHLFCVLTPRPPPTPPPGSFNRDPNLTVVGWSTGAEGDSFMLAFMELSTACLGPECLPASEAAYNATMASFWGGAHQVCVCYSSKRRRARRRDRFGHTSLCVIQL